MDEINHRPIVGQPEPMPSTGNKKKIILIISGVILVLAIIGGIVWARSNKKSNPSSTSKSASSNATASKPADVKFEEAKIDQYSVTIQKPTGWTTEVKDGVAYVKEDANGETETMFTFIKGVSDKINAVGLANALVKKTQKTYPDFAFTAKISKNQGIVELDATFTNNQKHKAKGTYLITLADGNGFFGGYETLVDQFDAKKSTLNYVLSSIKQVAIASTQKTTTQTSDPNASTQLSSKTVNSATISVPSDWTVTGIGSPGNIVAANADGTFGYIGQTVSIFPTSMADIAAGNPVSDYKGPGDFLKYVYLPALNNTNINIEKEVDASSILEGAEGAEAKVDLLTFKNSSGQSLKSLILALTLNPSIITGAWSALVYGFWTPADQFDAKYTLMTRIATSYTPDEATIKQVTAEKLKSYQEGISRLSQTLSNMLEDSYKSTAGTTTTSTSGETSQQIEDRMYDKWNDYAAGEERLYSASEGKVYTLPAGYDKYYNPTNSSEQLDPVSNSQWNSEVDRSYLPGGWHYGL